MTDGITLLTEKRIIKHYIEDLIFKSYKKFKNLIFFKVVENNKKIVKKLFIYKISKTFDFFGLKKIIMFFSVLLYGITQ